jgi:hypothetical protein
MIGFINFKISQFFRLNLISLNLNHQIYKLNMYFLILLFICIISSIIIRSNLINLDITELLDSNNVFIRFSIIFIFILSSIYSIKLVFDILNKCFQAFSIIPDFINWYKQDVKNIKSIITYYYIQNILLILLSSFILYVIVNKLSLFINNVDLFILLFGIIFSLIFIYNFKFKFKFILNSNIKTLPIWVYLLIIFFFIFYIFIFPLTIFKIIDSDKFISFKDDFINKCLENVECNMDNELRIENNTHNQSIISVPNRNRLDTLINNSDNNTSVIVRDNRNSFVQNINIDQINVVNESTQTGNNHNPLINENNLLTNEGQGNNLLNNNNPLVQEPSSSNTNLYKFWEKLDKEAPNLFTKPIFNIEDCTINETETIRELNIPKIVINNNNIYNDNSNTFIKSNESLNSSNLCVENESIDTSSSFVSEGSRSKINLLRKYKSTEILNKIKNSLTIFSNKSESNIIKRDFYQELIEGKNIIKIPTNEYGELVDNLLKINQDICVIKPFNNPETIELYNKLSDDFVDLLVQQESLYKNKDFSKLEIFIHIFNIR